FRRPADIRAADGNARHRPDPPHDVEAREGLASPPSLRVSAQHEECYLLLPSLVTGPCARGSRARAYGLRPTCPGRPYDRSTVSQRNPSTGTLELGTGRVEAFSDAV